MAVQFVILTCTNHVGGDGTGDDDAPGRPRELPVAMAPMPRAPGATATPSPTSNKSHVPRASPGTVLDYWYPLPHLPFLHAFIHKASLM